MTSELLNAAILLRRGSWVDPELFERAAKRMSELEEWKNAVEEASVVNWTLNESNANDPRKAINDLIACIMRESLDPMVSQPAADLHAKIAELERDAERYRWLRANANSSWDVWADYCGDRMKQGDSLDAAIDAAITESAK